MSRGPRTSVGFKVALPVALARGHVDLFKRQRGSTADLMISGCGILAIVLLRKAPRLHGTLADIEAEFHDAIALLRIHTGGGPVSRELWLYSRYGVLRYFRVEDAGIVEITADGKILAAGPVVPATTSVTGTAPAGKKSGKKIPAVQEEFTAEATPTVLAPGSEVMAAQQEPVAEGSPGGPCE